VADSTPGTGVPGESAVTPRVFALSLNRGIPHQEIPPEFLRARLEREPDPGRAVEIAPGVRITLMGTGDILLPDGEACYGARIAVWADPVTTHQRGEGTSSGGD
jgi:hypothetical protein